MTTEVVMTVIRETVTNIMVLSAPFLIISVVLGLIIAVFQAATQIHEQTITFVPKLMGILVLLLICGPWILTTLVEFFRMILNLMQEL